MFGSDIPAETVFGLISLFAYVKVDIKQVLTLGQSINNVKVSLV